MLTDNQKAGVRELCTFLDFDVVKSVAETATKGKLAITTVNEAIDALILHSDSALWLLNRKKLTRTLLFEYLHAKKVPISGKAEKIDIINKIIECWDLAPLNNSVVNYQPVVANHEPSITTTFQNVTQNVVQPHIRQMGLEFAKWFYEILLGVHRQTVPAEQLANQFWRDTTLRITLNSQNATDIQEAKGGTEAAQLLSVLLCQYGYLFNPNLSNDGVREKTSAHGLAVIAVCGTVHQHDNCTGIFEQAFGLVQDPTADFSWRIKWSDLRVTQAAVSQVPCISDLPELRAICDGSAC